MTARPSQVQYLWINRLLFGVPVLIASVAHAQPTLQPVGTLESWQCERYSIGISASGIRIAANMRTGPVAAGCPYRYAQFTDDNGIDWNGYGTSCSIHGGGPQYTAMSDNGSAFAGTEYCLAGPKQPGYRSSFCPVPLYPIPASVFAWATDLNANGTVAVGVYQTTTPDELRIVRSSTADGVQDIGKPEGSIRCGYPAVSGTGDTFVFGCLFPQIVGEVTNRLYRWTAATGVVRVEMPYELYSIHSASLSGNGAFVIGTMVTPSGNRAFRHEIATGITQDLGTLPNRSDSFAGAFNQTGTIITGSSGGMPFVWKSGSGIMDLVSMIPNLNGFTNISISGISSGADAWCGNGTRDGKTQPFKLIGMNARLACDDIDFNNDGSSFDPQDIAAFLSVYSEGSCIPAAATCQDIDFNNDGSVFDPCDINSFLRVYSEGPCRLCGV